MQILQNMYPDIKEVIGVQSYSSDKKYVPSQFIYKERVDEGWLYFNSLSKVIALLNDGEAMPMKEAVENWFFFEEGVDQYDFLMTMKDAYRKNNQKDNLEHIVVFTTMGCNARCPYCYEKNYGSKLPMSPKVAYDSAKWICDHVKQPYSVQWFGGEPLTNSEAIDIISKYLNENSPYEWRSSIITNGYLIDNIGVQKMIEEYHIGSVQITLDGIYNDYNNVKNFVYNDANPFSKVINNMQLLVENGVKIDVRLNVTKDNLRQLSAVVSYLHEKFGDDRLLYVYSNPVYPEQGTDFSEDDRTKMYENYVQLQSLIKKTFSYEYVSKDWDKINVTNCMADRGVGMCITPTGNLSLCEHHVNEELIGNIYTDKYDTDLIKSWKVETKDDEKCKHCPYKPMCFYLDKCPGSLKCNEVLQRYRHNTVHDNLVQWYKHYKNHDVDYVCDASYCFKDVVLPEDAVFLDSAIPR